MSKQNNDISYVYLLVGSGKDAGKFKIGISVRPYVRSTQIVQDVDLEKSVCVGYSVQQARENESWLHQYFAKYRLNKTDVGDGCGNTEWFDMQCFEEALEILNFNESKTGVKKIAANSVRLNMDIPSELMQELKYKAYTEGMTISNVVQNLIEGYLASPASLKG